MRRVSIKEAASLLGVDESAVKTQMKCGRLVACQDAEYRGYVWLKDTALASSGRDSMSKSQSVKDISEAVALGEKGPVSTESTESASRQGLASKSEDRERRPRSGQQSPTVRLLQEVIATLKEELRAKDRQLELKDAELQARREEVRGLLAILHQSGAVPSAAD
jgi:hypothetical protein